jgi:beta-glucosidase
LSIEERVQDLMSRMTIEEKISQLMNISPEIERLGIPKYDWRNECLQGVAFRGKATIFPQAIAMAATWNPNLIQKVASAISDEARAKHHEFAERGERGRWQGLTFSCPNINIFRDPRWGRGQETFGEDPYLTSKISVAFIKGLQGNHPKYLKIVAEPKHFAVHSGPEKLRHEINVIVNKKDLYETYLPAFQASFQDGHAAGVMSAYNRVNGKAACASGMLIKDILRGEYGFDGYLIGDGGAVTDIFKHHKMVNSLEEAVAMALNAGCDIINPMDLQTLAKIKKYRRAIKNALESGLTSKEVINNNLQRVLTARFKLGIFDPPEHVPHTKIPYNIVNCKAHQDLALKTARESIILLQNKGNILPLKKDISSIAIIGPNANNSEAFYYFHYYPGKYNIITPLMGIKNKVSSNTKIFYSKGSDLTEGNNSDLNQAIELANKAEIVILVLGITGRIEGEEGYVIGKERGDRVTLNLPTSQEILIKRINETGKPIILILTSGSALSVNYAKENVPVILQACYAGERGGDAIADVLFGDYNPAGRLPVTFYKSVDQLPDFENYNMENRTYRYFNGEPLYAFGYGLSYTRFQYSNLQITPKKIKSGETVSVIVDVKNIGKYVGDEVIQLYLSKKSPNFRVPIRELKGFSRTHFEAGEIKTLHFTLTPSEYKSINNEGSSIIDPGEVSIWIGGCQPGFDDGKNIVHGSFELI